MAIDSYIDIGENFCRAQVKEPAVVGLNFRQAELAIREKFSVSSGNYSIQLQQVLQIPGVEEAVLLSTCNRLELIAGINGSVDREDVCLRGAISSLLPRGFEDFEPQFYRHQGPEAVRHVFRVASGLDSMVLGEPQILGQMKQAYKSALELGATKGLLNRLFHRAFGAAKRVRTDTALGRNSVSVLCAVRSLVQQIFGDISDVSVMIIGHGEMGRNALKQFSLLGVRRIFLVLRSHADLGSFEKSSSITCIKPTQIRQFLPDTDVVIGAAGRGLTDPYLLEREDARRVRTARRGRPQFFVDLGVPRNFDSNIADLEDCFLYNLDDLGEIVRINLDSRRLEVEKASLIVEEESSRFWRWIENASVHTVLSNCQDRLDSLLDSEISKSERRLKRLKLDEEGHTEVMNAFRDFADAFSAKSFHRAFNWLRDRGIDDAKVLEFFRDCFTEGENSNPSILGRHPELKDGKIVYGLQTARHNRNSNT